MTKHFDLKKQLKLHDKTLLRRLFVEEHGVLSDLAWDDLRPHDIEPNVEAWNGIPHDVRRKVELILQDVNELADGRTHRVLVEDLEWSHPELKERFTAWPSSADRALWAYLDARLLFDEAAKFARAEAYRGGQFSNRWNSLPKDPLGVTPSLTEALEHGVRDYYREKELRADHCRVHHYRRGNGADYFYAYIPEWADKRLGFDANGELTPRELNYAFHNVFIFEPKDGSLEIIAKGGKKVQMPLRRTFCQSILNLVVKDTDPIKPCYHLDQLMEPSFHFTTEPEDKIAHVWLRRIRFETRVKGSKLHSGILEFGDQVSLREARGLADKFLDAYDYKRTDWSVDQVGIQIEFVGDGSRKRPTMTFHIGLPNTCDLKSKPDEVREVGERCIRRWGILRD
jgi:hypothetical protein